MTSASSATADTTTLPAPASRCACADARLVKRPVDSSTIAGGGPPDPTWSGQVQAILAWLAQRTTWLDAQFP